ncbi:LysM peptidoglycan-binding domain-containing protein [Planctomonas psychrotolerans]|uniref:LysM peptidoglycan-binding domain-containing protein n=1 Tax=Planctomonas psychrotolerans TaxID=2528712 RepID=UPI001D0D0B47|nr:LysM domain-containing protein [Planctomonas psychrotolerans]
MIDAGSGGGANGQVVTDEAGRPVAYTVAPGDLLAEVAGRFGMYSDDLFHLNPARSPSPEDPVLYVGEALNLDLRKR